MSCPANQLSILDVSNPTSPSVIGTLDLPGSGYGLAIQGDLAFVASYAEGLYLEARDGRLDASDLAGPEQGHAVRGSKEHARGQGQAGDGEGSALPHGKARVAPGAGGRLRQTVLAS